MKTYICHLEEMFAAIRFRFPSATVRHHNNTHNNPTQQQQSHALLVRLTSRMLGRSITGFCVRGGERVGRGRGVERMGGGGGGLEEEGWVGGKWVCACVWEARVG